MEYLPVGLKLSGRRVLLVGGGVVATRKARLLSRAGAILEVVAPEVSDELQRLIAAGAGQHHPCAWDDRELVDYVAVVAATSDAGVNQRLAAQASRRNIPVNVVDDPAHCSFIVPAIVDRDPLLVAITSSGASPVLARRIRTQIEAMLPASYGRLARFLRERRGVVASRIASENQRRVFWERLLDSPLTEQVCRGDDAAANTRFEQALAAAASASEAAGSTPKGAVYLIGAGPGDPDLMTFKAVRLLQRADIVLYDRLVGPGIVELARRDAERIYVGKQAAEHTMPQSEINAALRKFAEQGLQVARLKGGDPFIFGRGGEEIEGLLAAGIDFEVVPGITAASGAACYGGIPLTHRDHAQSVRFITGHTRDHRLELPWAEFLNPRETLVFYMGLAGLAIISRELRAAGRDPQTPVALVEKATLPEQRVIVGTLDTIDAVVAEQKPSAPTLLIIGSVVSLHPELGWFSP